jgi:hypothetical protein
MAGHPRHRDLFACAQGARGATAGPRTFNIAYNPTEATLNVT